MREAYYRDDAVKWHQKFRVGFAFVGLSREQERPVQQYVTNLERQALVLAKGE